MSGTRKARVGLFGLLGSGNIGNDASLEAMLRYFRSRQPGAMLDALCSAPETVRERYGLNATPMHWQPLDGHEASGVSKMLRRSLGKVTDTIRIASWVRRHDVVVVPGMGVLETTLPVRPWQFPYDMFILCAAGRLFRTKVALVCIGANVAEERLTRWLFGAAGRMAYYRSYRDELSRKAMRRQGVNTAKDHVYPDLAFGLPVPDTGPGDPQVVGLGLIDYYGNDDNHAQPDEIHASYLESMKSFTRWLVDNGRRVRLFVGDTNNADGKVVEEVLADIRAARPDLGPEWVVAEPVVTFADLMRAMSPASLIVATRYHNVICALMLAKPTISIGYGEKNAVLMADAGVGEYCQSINALDLDRLVKQLTDAENQLVQLRHIVAEGNAAKAPLLEQQLDELDAVLFPALAS